jgi:ABC-2 type transport system ATP-binding protein
VRTTTVDLVLEVTGLSKRFESVQALDDVGFSVAAGQIVGFLGPNGAGKTTAMRAIMRLVALDAGTVRWDGVNVDPAVRQRFGYMPAERGMYQRMKVRQHLVYYATLSGRREASARRMADEWLERLGLADRAGDAIQTLSSGNQQRVQLALALINEPDLLVLDEPFSGLDPIAVDVLSELLREQVERGAALLLSSHQLDLVAAVCSSVVIVDHGRVVLRGEVAELRANSPTRIVEVEFAAPTAWHPASHVATSDGGRTYRIRVGEHLAADALIRDAEQLGTVLAYSYSPPDLSEIFLGAVGGDNRRVVGALAEEPAR